MLDHVLHLTVSTGNLPDISPMKLACILIIIPHLAPCNLREKIKREHSLDTPYFQFTSASSSACAAEVCNNAKVVSGEYWLESASAKNQLFSINQ